MRRAAALSLLFLCLGGPSAGAMPAAELARKLPRIWCGAFTWGLGDEPQRYRVELRRVTVAADGRVRAVGIGINSSTRNRPTRVTFTAMIDAATMSITMREADPVPPTPTYITNGRFEGRLSPPLDRIEAHWIDTRPPLPNARLVLDGGRKASAHSHCVDPVS